MKFYLSSFKLGDHPTQLVDLMAPHKKIGYVPNACDYTNVDIKRRKETNEGDMAELNALGLEVELLDMKLHFGETVKLRRKINDLGGLFFRGGNTFILRQAMRMSGFDIIFKELLKRKDFVYAGYSAGICILSPDLRVLQMADDPTDKPYSEIQETIWEGLGYLDRVILPHYQSNHPESATIDKLVEYCQKNSVPFRT